MDGTQSSQLIGASSILTTSKAVPPEGFLLSTWLGSNFLNKANCFQATSTSTRGTGYKIACGYAPLTMPDKYPETALPNQEANEMCEVGACDRSAIIPCDQTAIISISRDFSGPHLGESLRRDRAALNSAQPKK